MKSIQNLKKNDFFLKYRAWN